MNFVKEAGMRFLRRLRATFGQFPDEILSDDLERRDRRRKSRSTKQKDRLGRRGERIAIRTLRAKGYRILDRNIRLPGGELDLVAFDGEYVVFVEVKTRRSRTAGGAVEAVSRSKRRRMRRLAESYLSRKRLDDRPARFDLVAITWADGHPTPEVEHLVDAFRD